MSIGLETFKRNWSGDGEEWKQQQWAMSGLPVDSNGLRVVQALPRESSQEYDRSPSRHDRRGVEFWSGHHCEQEGTVLDGNFVHEQKWERDCVEVRQTRDSLRYTSYTACPPTLFRVTGSFAYSVPLWPESSNRKFLSCPSQVHFGCSTSPQSGVLT